MQSSRPSMKKPARNWSDVNQGNETMQITFVLKAFLVCVLLLSISWLSLLLLHLPGGHFLRMYGTSAGVLLCVVALTRYLHRRPTSGDATANHGDEARRPKHWGWRVQPMEPNRRVGAVLCWALRRKAMRE